MVKQSAEINRKIPETNQNGTPLTRSSQYFVAMHLTFYGSFYLLAWSCHADSVYQVGLRNKQLTVNLL